MITTRLTFDHHHRTDVGSEGPIEICVTVDKKPYYINSSVRVRKSEWRHGFVVNRADCNELNERLAVLMRAVEREITKCVSDGRTIDVKVIRKKIYNGTVDDSEMNMIKWMENELPSISLKEGTRRHYDTLIRRMHEYGHLNVWGDLNVENIYEWDNWLHHLTKPQSNGDIQSGREYEPIGNGAVFNYHKRLKSLINRAIKIGIIDSNPYDRLRGEFPRGEEENIEFLTEEEIRAIESMHPMEGTQSAMARDLFIFQLYTGLAYSDAQAFDINDYRFIDGRWQYNGKRIKTGVPYVSELLPQALEVLERYGMQVPKVNNSQYNASLKVIQQALGIQTRLHSHLGRHTFATRALSLGVPLQNVSKMLGHKNIKQTQRYAKVLAEDVHENYQMMREKFSKRQ